MALSGPWPKGVRSDLPPQFIGDDQLQWSFNTINRGGATTRPGFRCMMDVATARDELEPRGLNVFWPRGVLRQQIVKVVGDQVRAAPAMPYTDPRLWRSLAEIDKGTAPVYFANCIKGTDKGVVLPESYPIMIMQTGVSAPYMWDGTTFRALGPTETPSGTICKWFGSRLWTAQGSKLFASDLLDPIAHTESDTLTGGGYLQFNGQITGLASTSDNQNLIVFTSDQTSAIQGSILDRSLWGSTIGFQTVVLEGIGCVAPFSIVNQYGMLWWMSQHGLVGLDEALHAYRSSRLHYKDGNMARSRGNFSEDVSGIAAGAYENFIVVSVPSGDLWNAHTWVMDQSPIDDINVASEPIWASCWTGIRPMQWITATIDGNPRIFALSRDYKTTGYAADWTTDVWEAFTVNKFDMSPVITPTSIFPDVAPRSIECSIETKLISPPQGGFATYGYAEVMTSGLSGKIHFEASYASSHSSYKKVLSKDVISTTDTLRFNENIPSFINARLPQTRRLKTDSDEAQLSDGNDFVEDVYTRNKDRGFSMLVKWTGIATIWSIILTFVQRGDIPVAPDEKDDETTDRFVGVEGVSGILPGYSDFHTPVSGRTSGPITVFGARSEDSSYSSMP